jgi:chromosome segregation ATPase
MKSAPETVQAIKELGHNVSAWEGRVMQLQMESESLKRKNDEVKKEIESSIALAQQELDKRREIASSECQKVQEEKEKLQKDKAQFQGILENFNKDRAEYEQERQKMLNIVEDAKKMRENVVNFIVFVKRESEKL